MICVLRIGATNDQQTQLLSGVAPYRKDSKEQSGLGIEVFYYDVADANDKSEFVSQISSFLARNRDALTRLTDRQDVQWLNLDIGLVLSGQALSASFDIPSDLVSQMRDFNMSLSASAYRAND